MSLSLPKFPRSGRLYWLLVTAAAAAAAAVAAWAAAQDASPARLAEVGLLVVAGASAERFRIQVPLVGREGGVHTSVSTAVVVASALLLPPPWLLLAVLAGMVGAGVWSRAPWYKVAFNAGVQALSAAAAAAVWRVPCPHTSIGVPEAAPWVVTAVLVYLAANTLLVALMVAILSATPLRHVWWRSLRPVLPLELAVAFLGVAVAWMWLTAPLLLVALVLPLVGLHFAFDDRIALEHLTLRLLFRVADVLEARDPYTHGHSQRVGDLSRDLAQHLGLPGDQVELVFLGGRLHDIGKCGVADAVLFKPGPLDDAELEHMRTHPVVGGRLLSLFKTVPQVEQYVRAHHERWDGRGYPAGLRGESIPLGARVIAVADAYDAMTTTRPYRTALPREEAARRLREGAGQQWDAWVVEGFLDLLPSLPASPPTTAGEDAFALRVLAASGGTLAA